MDDDDDDDDKGSVVGWTAAGWGGNGDCVAPGPPTAPGGGF